MPVYFGSIRYCDLPLEILEQQGYEPTEDYINGEVKSISSDREQVMLSFLDAQKRLTLILVPTAKVIFSYKVDKTF